MDENGEIPSSHMMIQLNGCFWYHGPVIPPVSAKMVPDPTLNCNLESFGDLARFASDGMQIRKTQYILYTYINHKYMGGSKK